MNIEIDYNSPVLNEGMDALMTKLSEACSGVIIISTFQNKEGLDEIQYIYKGSRFSVIGSLESVSMQLKMDRGEIFDEE